MSLLKAFLSWLRSRGTAAPWAVIATATAAIVLPWFLEPGYLFFTDFVWGPSVELNWRSSSLPLWLALHGLGTIVPHDLAQKLFLTALLAFVAWSGYKLAASVAEDRMLASVLSLFLIFNPYVYDRLGYGQIGVIAALGCMALGMAGLIRAYRSSNPRMILLIAALWFGLSVAMTPHFVFFSGTLGLVWLAAYLARWRVRVRPVIAITALVLGVLIVVAMNARWVILPSYKEAGVGIGAAVATFGSKDFEAFRTSGRDGLEAWRNVLMFSGFWGKDQLRYIDLTTAPHNWGRSYLLLLAIAVVGASAVWRGRKERPLAAGLFGASVISAFLAVGVSSGVTKIVTLWLIDHMPLYVGLRETQKWVAVLVVVFGVFLAWGAARIFESRIISRNRAVSLMALALICVMQAPSMLWGLAGAVRPAEYPVEWEEAKMVLSEKGCGGRVMFFPRHLYMGFSWIGSVVSNPTAAYFDCVMMVGTDPEWYGVTIPNHTNNADIEEFVAGEGVNASTVFRRYKVGHVMLAKEVDWEKYAWVEGLPELRQIYSGERITLYEVIR